MAVIPSLTLHWLPSVISNPSIALNPGQVSALTSQLGGGGGGGALQSQLGGSGTPPGETAKEVIRPYQRGSTLTEKLEPKPVHSESHIEGGSEQGSPTDMDLSQSRSGSRMTQDLRTAQELKIAQEATLLPAVRVPVQSGTVPLTTGVGTIISSEVPAIEQTIKKERYVSELESVISPKGIIFNITIQTVILSALVFVAVLTWFEFVRTWYDETFNPTLGIRNVNLIFTRFWYAVYITTLVIIIVYIIYRWSKSYKTE